MNLTTCLSDAVSWWTKSSLMRVSSHFLKPVVTSSGSWYMILISVGLLPPYCMRSGAIVSVGTPGSATRPKHSFVSVKCYLIESARLLCQVVPPSCGRKSLKKISVNWDAIICNSSQYLCGTGSRLCVAASRRCESVMHSLYWAHF